MLNTIYLVTKNKHKLNIAQVAMKPYGITVEQLAFDTPEIQSTDTEEVVKYSVKFAADLSKKPVIKGDLGMSIDCLNGFPGPFVKYINKWLRTEQFVRLYELEANKKAYFIDALGYCEPGKEPICFTAKTYGTLANIPRGDNGNMVDSLFIPDGYDKTIAELSVQESIKLWNNDRYSQLVNFLKSLD